MKRGHLTAMKRKAAQRGRQAQKCHAAWTYILTCRRLHTYRQPAMT